MIASIKSLLARSNSTDSLKQLIKFTFQLLILLLPTQLALHFWPNWAYVYGFKIDYFSPTLYLTDVLIILLFALWVIQYFFEKNRNQKRATGKGVYLLLTILLIIFMGANIYFAKSPWVAIYKWIKIVELILLGLFIARIREFKFSSWVAKPLSFSLIAVSAIAIIQFNLQKTIGGALFLLGERSFTASTPGIATFTLFGREMLRPYSVFPHPNVLAGFLGVSFFLLLFGLNEKIKMPLYYRFSLILALLILVLSISHGAWISFVLAGLVLIFAKTNENVFRRLYVLTIIIVIAISLFLPTVSDRATSSFDYNEAVSHRLHLIKASGSLIAENPIVGIGEGNYILGLVENVDFPKLSWWLQPVHNIFLLAFSEIGLIGLGFFVSLLLVAINKAILKKKKIFLAALMFIVLTGFLDHYWITLQQTQTLFAVLLGLMFRKDV